jgi:L-ascorbate metabolism protein UlaG (beta-lactamase superfamily)
MERLNIGIKYLYHSGFSVETDTHFLIFDFYQGYVNLPDKKTYVFVSHNHPDHYNPEIFEWQKKQPGIQYILSYDIHGDPDIPPGKDNIAFISPYEEKQIDDIKVKTYNSTDEGVSFLVQCDGINIFHAGDLNWWYWADDIPEEIKTAEKGFKEEIAKIKGEHIDIAFFPVDPRLKPNCFLGAELFINEINPHYFIPMHFWDDHEIVGQFKDRMKFSSTQIIEFARRGQEIRL